jgi:para-nitrobenzyl esterase
MRNTKHARNPARPALRCWLPAFAIAVAGAAHAAPVGHTQNGKVTGFVSGTLDEFLGIRYAAPPVGSLRWQPTQPVPADLATHQALAFGPHCAQLPSAYGIASNAEDCLYLNIYRPSKLHYNDATSLPVMVWIHGGALVVGESDDYDPAPLIAQNNVVVVTINYRLGYLGYLAVAGLDAEGHTAANYGLMDQQFALDWVNRNIAGFGGDPGNVTVFGESAGGLSTLSNVISPTAHGLFNKAIVESGAYSIQLPTLAQAETAGDALATALGCSDTDTACLRGVPVANILAQQSSPTLSLTTIVDGTTLPLSINAAFSSGHFNRVPMINGSNHDEYRQFVSAYASLTAQEYPGVLVGLFGADLGAAVAAKYPVGNYSQPVLALAAVLTDYEFACPANLIDKWASRYVPTYAYEFNDRHVPQDFIPPAGYPFGAPHASELQFLFDIPKLPGTRPLNANEIALSAIMSSYWTNFAVTESPAAPGVPSWLPFASKTNNMQSFVPPTAFEETNFASVHKCGFWAPVINP